MTGIKFVTGNRGKKTAVIIDLRKKRNARLWEDFYDAMIAEERKNEPCITLQEMKDRLIRAGKL